MGIFDSITELIGKTPLVKLNRIGEGSGARIFAKLEYLNPFGSVKDRVALGIIASAEEAGLVDKETTIIEATTGNTGISLAYLCAAKGYRLILTMPDVLKEERKRLLRLLGAEIVMTPPLEGMGGAVRKAKALSKEIPGAFMINQFENPANPEIHRRTTAEEIWKDTEGKVDVLVAGVGTGGTITGVGEVLKERRPGLKTIAVEPEESAVLSGNLPGTHGIFGIGAGFIPPLLNREVIDEVMKVSTRDAYATVKTMAYKEGILCGVSSGAALWAALKVSKRKEFQGKNIVVIMPDGGERYLHTRLIEGFVPKEQ